LPRRTRKGKRRSGSDLAATSSRIRAVYAVSLLGGTITHAATLFTCGLLCNYGGVPVVTRVFWTSLTFVDPLAAMLLFVRPRVGLALTLLIMLADVAINTVMWLMFRNAVLAFNWINRIAYASQIAFLIFVVLTIKSAARLGTPLPANNNINP
jgi:hypothetical protein